MAKARQQVPERSNDGKNDLTEIQENKPKMSVGRATKYMVDTHEQIQHHFSILTSIFVFNNSECLEI